MNQIIADSFKQYIKDLIDKEGRCWNFPLKDGLKYCHFLVDMCPYHYWESEATIIDYIPTRSEFHRCKL